MGASFQAPPQAETQPAAEPRSSSAGRGSARASPRARRTQATSPAARRTPAPAAQRRARSWTTSPRTWNCMGIEYFDWSSSRRKVL